MRWPRQHFELITSVLAHPNNEQFITGGRLYNKKLQARPTGLWAGYSPVISKLTPLSNKRRPAMSAAFGPLKF